MVIKKKRDEPSERANLQLDLVDLITELGYNAPYGILTGMKDLPRGGFARTITFGMARTLDAVITIWSVKRISVKAQGALAYRFLDEYIDTPEGKAAEKLAADLAKAAGRTYPTKAVEEDTTQKTPSTFLQFVKGL